MKKKKIENFKGIDTCFAISMTAKVESMGASYIYKQLHANAVSAVVRLITIKVRENIRLSV